MVSIKTKKPLRELTIDELIKTFNRESWCDGYSHLSCKDVCIFYDRKGMCALSYALKRIPDEELNREYEITRRTVHTWLEEK